MPGQLVAFATPQTQENSDGWGPTTVPDELKDIPFAPFSKGDKLGRVSDFTSQGFNKQYGRYGQRMDPINPVFNFFHNEQEDDFHLVDSKPMQRGRGQRRFQPNRFQNQQRGRDGDKRNEGPGDKRRQQQQQQQRNRMGGYRDNQRQMYTSSVDIRPDWRVLEQVNFSALTKLSLSVDEPEDLAFCGSLWHYDKSYDRLTAKNTKRLEKTQRVFSGPASSEDPMLMSLAQQGAAQVFATDTLLTALMSTPRTSYPWDLLIVKKQGQVFLDLRPGSTLGQLTANETAPDAAQEDKDALNGMPQLMNEATAVNRAFSQQVLLRSGERHECGQAHPFAATDAELDSMAGTAFRYRKWQLSDSLSIIVRCEVDGISSIKGQDQLLLIKALNEYDPRVSGLDWRQKLDQQRGAVLATELKNNAAKVARWTAQALLASADIIKLGFASRVSSRDNKAHVLLGAAAVKPREFAQQISLSMENCWGIVRAIVDLIMQQEDGKYLLVKDPNKPMLRIYEVPVDAFEASYAEGDKDEEEEDEEEEEEEA